MPEPSGRVSLRQLLKEKGKSQLQIAKAARLSTWTINGACKGVMSAETREAIASVLDIEPSALGEPTLQSKTKVKSKIKPQIKQVFGVDDEIASEPKASRPEPEVPEEQPAQPVASVKPSIGILAAVASEITDEESDALVGAFIKTRKSKGFSESEFAFVESWAEKIRADSTLLQLVLSGKANIDIQENDVKVLDPEIKQQQQQQVALPARNAPDLDQLVDAHLTWGKSEHAWQDYYLSEKRNIIKNWKKILGLTTLSDLTIPKFDRVIKNLIRDDKSRQTVEKHAKHLATFVEWAVEKSFIPANILAGKASAQSLRDIAKEIGKKW